MFEQSAQSPTEATPSGGNGAQGTGVQGSQGTAAQPAQTPLAAAAQPAQVPVATPQPKKYFASIFPGPTQPLPEPFVNAVQSLEASLGIPLWLYVQDGGDGKFDDVNEAVRKAFWTARSEMQPNQPIALMIDSPGGYAKSAYLTATQVRRYCGDFTAVIPRYAKSAATLLALGAGVIIMNRDAELGPLDVQIFDPEREDWASALNEVQTVERLQAASLSLLDQTMLFLIGRTGKKLESTLPHALKFVSDMMRPMFENIDIVHFTHRARDLKVAEDYAIRLLRTRYPLPQAELIGRQLVSAYPDHGFVIDAEETVDFCAPQLKLNLNVTEPTPDQNRHMDALVPVLGKITVLGRLQEIQTP